MTREQHVINYGSGQIEYYLERRNRKTLGISVTPTGIIEVVAPDSASLRGINERVEKRARWITEKRIYFQQFEPKQRKTLFVSGATRWYLGRRYRLKLIESNDEKVLLKSGRFWVSTIDPDDIDRVTRLLSDWYRDHAHSIFCKRLKECIQKFPNPEEVEPNGLHIRQMKKRWGSMSPSGKLILNVRLVEFPKRCIDYVIVHELSHRIHNHHRKQFWQLVEQALPQWEKEKTRLETLAAEIVVTEQ